jgi:phosphatidylglycerophosphate synthase
MPEHGRKVPECMENPIDAVLVNIAEPLSNSIHKISPHITANMITAIGMVIGVACIACLAKGYYLAAFILYWICYFFDVLDGYYARKYDMITKFGDYFDHFRDVFINIVVCWFIWWKLEDQSLRDIFIITLIVFGIGMLSHFGCQEQNTSFTEHNDCLAILKPLIKHKEYISFTKHFGCGTFIFAISLFILVLSVKNR